MRCQRWDARDPTCSCDPMFAKTVVTTSGPAPGTTPRCVRASRRRFRSSDVPGGVRNLKNMPCPVSSSSGTNSPGSCLPATDREHDRDATANAEGLEPVARGTSRARCGRKVSSDRNHFLQALVDAAWARSFGGGMRAASIGVSVRATKRETITATATVTAEFHQETAHLAFAKGDGSETRRRRRRSRPQRAKVISRVPGREPRQFARPVFPPRDVARCSRAR